MLCFTLDYLSVHKEILFFLFKILLNANKIKKKSISFQFLTSSADNDDDERWGLVHISSTRFNSEPRSLFS